MSKISILLDHAMINLILPEFIIYWYSTSNKDQKSVKLLLVNQWRASCYI